MSDHAEMRDRFDDMRERAEAAEADAAKAWEFERKMLLRATAAEARVTELEGLASRAEAFIDASGKHPELAADIRAARSREGGHR